MRGALRAGVLLLLALVLLAQAAHLGLMLGELAIAWSLHAAVLLLLCQPLLHWARERRLQLAALIGVALATWAWIPAWLEPRVAELNGGPELVLLSANTFHHHPEVEAAAKRIEASGADVVALIEPDLRLFALLPSYTAIASHPSGDKYGVALLIRPSPELEVVRASTVAHAFTPAPLIEAELRHRGRPVRLFAIHVMAPTDPDQMRQRALQVEALMERVRTSTAPVILLGDLNMVMASPLWRELRAQDRLRRPPGCAPATWPRQLAELGIGIAIDHILLDPRFSASPAEAMDLSRSDHRGVRTGVAW